MHTAVLLLICVALANAPHLAAADASGQDTRRRAYENALKIATVDSRSPLMTTAAAELKARGRCHLTDPFSGRRD
jgi:hypothetical protein